MRNFYWLCFVIVFFLIFRPFSRPWFLFWWLMMMMLLILIHYFPCITLLTTSAAQCCFVLLSVVVIIVAVVVVTLGLLLLPYRPILDRKVRGRQQTGKTPLVRARHTQHRMPHREYKDKNNCEGGRGHSPSCPLLHTATQTHSLDSLGISAVTSVEANVAQKSLFPCSSNSIRRSWRNTFFRFSTYPRFGPEIRTLWRPLRIPTHLKMRFLRRKKMPLYALNFAGLSPNYSFGASVSFANKNDDSRNRV